MVSERQKIENLAGDALERNILAICENSMHRNGNLGLRMGVSPLPRHIPQHMKCPPPPRHQPIFICGSLQTLLNKVPLS